MPISFEWNGIIKRFIQIRNQCIKLFQKYIIIFIKNYFNKNQFLRKIEIMFFSISSRSNISFVILKELKRLVPNLFETFYNSVPFKRYRHFCNVRSQLDNLGFKTIFRRINVLILLQVNIFEKFNHSSEYSIQKTRPKKRLT